MCDIHVETMIKGRVCCCGDSMPQSLTSKKALCDYQGNFCLVPFASVWGVAKAPWSLVYVRPAAL